MLMVPVPVDLDSTTGTRTMVQVRVLHVVDLLLHVVPWQKPNMIKSRGN